MTNEIESYEAIGQYLREQGMKEIVNIVHVKGQENVFSVCYEIEQSMGILGKIFFGLTLTEHPRSIVSKYLKVDRIGKKPYVFEIPKPVTKS